MIFLGTTFCGGKYTLFPPATPQSQLFTLQINDGTYNHIFVSNNALHNGSDYLWDEDTVLNASFDEDFTAGNQEFNLTKTDTVIIRRRESGTQNWITLYVKPIKNLKDFEIHFVDKYAKAKTDYQYKVSSYKNRVENATIITDVYSDFDGWYITDKDCLYGTIYNIDGCDTTRNITAQTLELLNSKYVHVVSNSSADYDSGSVSGVFLDYDSKHDTLSQQGSLSLRTNVKNRLANKKPLILKVHDGRIWMVRVTGNIGDANAGHVYLRTISFDWVEVGDINDMRDLYGYGFVDVSKKSGWW